MSSIQPETTITLTGKGSVDHAPDIAMISVGVNVEAALTELSKAGLVTLVYGPGASKGVTKAWKNKP